MSPGRIDPQVVRRHLLALDEALKNLSLHTGRPLEALHGTDERWVVERGLQLAVQNALDIATHIAAGAGLDATDYASAIDRLGEVGVVSREFAGRLRSIAGFRNVLVHGYLVVDLEMVHRVLNVRLADLRELAAQVERYLATTS